MFESLPKNKLISYRRFAIKRYSPAWNTICEPNDDSTVMQIGWASYRVKIPADLRIDRYVNVRSNLSPTFCCNTYVANWYRRRTNRQKVCLLIVIRINSNQDGTRQLTKRGDQKEFGSLCELLKSKNIIPLICMTCDLTLILYSSSLPRMEKHIHCCFLYFNKRRAMHSFMMFVSVYLSLWPSLFSTDTIDGVQLVPPGVKNMTIYDQPRREAYVSKFFYRLFWNRFPPTKGASEQSVRGLAVAWWLWRVVLYLSRNISCPLPSPSINWSHPKTWAHSTVYYLLLDWCPAWLPGTYNDSDPGRFARPYELYCWCRRKFICLVVSYICHQLASVLACRPVEILDDIGFASMLSFQMGGFAYTLGAKYALCKRLKSLSMNDCTEIRAEDCFSL